MSRYQHPYYQTHAQMQHDDAREERAIANHVYAPRNTESRNTASRNTAYGCLYDLVSENLSIVRFCEQHKRTKAHADSEHGLHVLAGTHSDAVALANAVRRALGGSIMHGDFSLRIHRSS